MANPLQAPTGLRDFYPQDLLRRRYIEKLWRDTAIRHGFEEIDGPAFEHAELYKIKSGEGILNEMFGVFSGKDESQRAALASGEAPYALRPEFTPTLARLYAAKAATLPKPCKWFWQQNCYRAEKPQRGRLREFMQWNCDVIGGEVNDYSRRTADCDAIAVVCDCLLGSGLDVKAANVLVNDRVALQNILLRRSVPIEQHEPILAYLDRATKLEEDERIRQAQRLNLPKSLWLWFVGPVVLQQDYEDHGPDLGLRVFAQRIGIGEDIINDSRTLFREWKAHLRPVITDLLAMGFDQRMIREHSSIVRGLAYYTGMVFEVIAEGERAVAGGGRYDNLIELFGGPPTPAVGFGMGDVVLTLLLQDKGLMPEGRDLLEALSAPAASFRPDAFVISNGTPEADAQVRPLVARLRRGTESAEWLSKEARKPWDAGRYRPAGDGDPAARPLHARHTYKATKNLGKLLKEASDQHARAAVIIESGAHATVRDLGTREELKDVAIERVPGVVVKMVGG